MIGNLFREGKIYTVETIEVFDHDFPSLAEGVSIPHAIYDLERNEAYVSIGTSRDTSEWTGRILREDKRGVIPENTPPILNRLNIKTQHWLYLTHTLKALLKD